MPRVEKIIAENLNLTIEDVVEGLLQASGTKGKIPTDVGEILGYLNLKQLSFDFMKELDFVPEITEKRDIRAVLSYHDRIIATHRLLHKNQTIFSTLHEIGHFVLPEHVEKFYLCSAEDLSFFTKLRLEGEANKLAANLIFQIDHFAIEANSFPLGCNVVTDLAIKYGTSFEATARRYVEQHSQPCALVVYDKVEKHVEGLEFDELPGFRVQYTITSKSFSENFFTKVLEEEIVPGKSSVYEAYRKLDVTQTVENKMSITIVGKGESIFDSQLFTNGYKVFRLIYPEK
ncbi:MAG: ImmA/IrrE family metallo-endopeptidase [Deltaproteobacteria bacterium]|nr:ImmA/IrrE family metallo-endopeptidase [Deltaproteobacteria bacterium]